MLSGMKLNSAYLKSKAMRVFCWLWLSLCAQTTWAAELLGHMSEEDVPLQQTLSPNASPLIYRVLCTPEQSDEPDCQRPPLEDSFEALSNQLHQASKTLPQSSIQPPQIEPSLQDSPLKSKSEQ